MSYVCPRCGNSDERYIGYFKSKPYCRLCLSFQGKSVENDICITKDIELTLDYPLSEKQKECSNNVLNALNMNRNVLIHAVTGAGKTELVYHSMHKYLKEGKKVGFATPRKDVVIDLAPRIKEAFKNAKVVSVYGEHSQIISGDIIVLTTHQLYRYPNYFDLLILDEIDAFPYKGNKLLFSFFQKSVKGNYVLLSATPSNEDINKVKNDNGIIITLFERYHKHDLIVPIFIQANKYKQFFLILRYLLKFIKEKKPVFIFTPTISEGKRLFFFLSLFFQNGSFVSSKEENRSIDISRIKNNMYDYLVTTSILERGVTLKNLQVIVYNAGSYIYSAEALIQIAGRVGRKIDATCGDVYFLSDEETPSIKDAIKTIKLCNLKKNNSN